MPAPDAYRPRTRPSTREIAAATRGADPLHGSASPQSLPEAIEIKAILDGVAAVEAEANRRWGIGRLRLLAPDALRAKFDAQTAKFEAARADGSIGAVRVHGGAMRRAWAALEAAAVEAGHTPLPPDVWELVLPSTGEVVALVRDPADIARAPTGRYVLLSEVAALIDGSATWTVLLRLKDQFPGAEVVAAGKRDGGGPTDRSPPPPIDWKVGDELPF